MKSTAKAQKDLVRQAMNQIQAETSIRFVLRKQQKDFIFIIRSENVCSSSVGRIGGQQHLTLSYNCFHLYIIIHELIHVLGFEHMQVHSDRDKFIKINTENIKDGGAYNFNAIHKELVDFGNGYDVRSIMHYDTKQFAKDESQDTITPLDEKNREIIDRPNKLMSKSDVDSIRNMYKNEKRRFKEKIQFIF